MKSFFICLGILITQLAFAQTYVSSIQGEVRDEITNQPLVGAEVFVLVDSTLSGSITDLDGRFIIEGIPVGRHDVFVQYLGYEAAIIPNVLVTTGLTKSVVVKMHESANTLETVEIVAQRDKTVALNPSALVSTRTFSIEEASRFAGSFNDPARMAQSFAGVSSGNDESNEIIIRGNSPRGIQWKLEGLEIPNPNHYREGEGGSGGAIAMIPDIMLANSDFYTGAFPAAYGNALSGVFDLSFRKGSNDKRQFSLQAGVLGLQAGAEGPIGTPGNGSYLFNYRYSTVTILEKLGLDFTDENDITPTFQDLAFHVHLPSKSSGQWSIYGFGGKSIAGANPVRNPEEWAAGTPRTYFDEVYKTGVIGVSNTLLFKNLKTSLNTVASINHQSESYQDFYINDDLSDVMTYDELYQYNDIRLASTLNHKINANWSAQAGIITSRSGFDVRAKDRLSNGSYKTFLDDDGSTYFIQSFVQGTYRPTDDWKIIGGTHLGYFTLNEQALVEPRLSTEYRLNEKTTLTAGIGKHSRLEPISLYLASDTDENGETVQRNKGLELTRAWHFISGISYQPWKNWHMKLEGYYQHLGEVPVFVNDDVRVSSLNFRSGFTSDQLLNDGIGRNYGIELTLEKFHSNGTFLLFTTSLFKSEYKTSDQSTEDWKQTRFSSNYVFNLLGGKEWKVGKQDNHLFGVNSRVIFRGGNREIPVDFTSSQQEGYVIYEYDLGYADQLSDFLRLDLGVSYRKNLKNWSWVLSLDIQNVMNRDNLLEREYNLSTNSYSEYFQLGMLPVLNYRVEF